MSARKIALTPAATYLVSMPAEHDPAKVTAETLSFLSFRAARAELEPICRASMAEWGEDLYRAVDSGGGAVEPVEAVEAASSAALNAWRAALIACDEGRLEDARAALEKARFLAGDHDAEERRALAMFEAPALIALDLSGVDSELPEDAAEVDRACGVMTVPKR